MKQVFQNMKSGETEVNEVPCPMSKDGELVIGSTRTLISKGTEKMLIDFSKSNLLNKAKQQPEKVKLVLDKIKSDGLLPTVEAVRAKFDQPYTFGYCQVGQVLDSGNTNYSVGDRVISNGNHAEVVRIPQNLTAKIPDNVDDDTAAFTVLGSIALQGIRLINPTLGETIVVTGLGLIGLMAVQILKANGCKVIGVDIDTAKCEIAKSFGVDVVDLSKGQIPVDVSNILTSGMGVDGVLITASSKSNDIIHEAATMCRKRGRIVLVGVIGLELQRSDFYEKELTFQVSCSYGPGRYETSYEDKGLDYPVDFVRWTEKRNFEAVLQLMSDGLLKVKSLITHRYCVDEAAVAYSNLDNNAALGILLEYPFEDQSRLTNKRVMLNTSRKSPHDSVTVSFIGAGNYASRTLIPAFKRNGAVLKSLITSGGVSGVHYGKQLGFEVASTDLNDAMNEESNTIAIVTRHNQHAEQVINGLNRGKNIFVEKPLAMHHEELDEIEAAYSKLDKKPVVMIGYNRRFSPHVQKIKELLKNKDAPKSFILTMNAGDLPADHWTQDSSIGGGRIIGEACHYIDLMRFLAGSNIKTWSAIKMADGCGVEITDDKTIINLAFEDGSIGTILYFANGSSAFPKERIEIFCDNAVLQLDNFRILHGFGWRGFDKLKTRVQDKGQVNCVKHFIQSIKEGTQSPIPFEEIIEVSRVTIDIAKSLRNL